MGLGEKLTKFKKSMDRFWIIALVTGLILAVAGPVIPGDIPRVLFIAMGLVVLMGGSALWLFSRFF